jgi:hypothetical protein
MRLRRSIVASLLAFAVFGMAATVRASGLLAEAIGFHGTGGKTLPTFRIVQPSTLFWRASGGVFELSSSLSSGDVNSERASGWTYLAPGRYQYTVNANGNWRFRVASGVVRPSDLADGFVSYSGDGSLELPPIHVRRAVTLSWKAPRGGIFQLTSYSGGGVTAQQKTNGTTRLAKGTYVFDVFADGPWTIKWKP